MVVRNKKMLGISIKNTLISSIVCYQIITTVLGDDSQIELAKPDAIVPSLVSHFCILVYFLFNNN